MENLLIIPILRIHGNRGPDNRGPPVVPTTILDRYLQWWVTVAVPELYTNFWFSSNFPIYFWTVWIPKPDGRIAIDQNVSERYQSNIYPRFFSPGIIGSTHVASSQHNSNNLICSHIIIWHVNILMDVVFD